MLFEGIPAQQGEQDVVYWQMLFIAPSMTRRTVYWPPNTTKRTQNAVYINLPVQQGEYTIYARVYWPPSATERIYPGQCNIYACLLTSQCSTTPFIDLPVQFIDSPVQQVKLYMMLVFEQCSINFPKRNCTMLLTSQTVVLLIENLQYIVNLPTRRNYTVLFLKFHATGIMCYWSPSVTGRKYCALRILQHNGECCTLTNREKDYTICCAYLLLRQNHVTCIIHETTPSMTDRGKKNSHMVRTLTECHMHNHMTFIVHNMDQVWCGTRPMSYMIRPYSILYILPGSPIATWGFSSYTCIWM